MPRKPNCKCEICGEPHYRRPSDLKRFAHVCCKECRSELYKLNKNYNKEGLEKGRAWNKGLSKKNGDILNYGRPRSELTKKRISEALRKVLIKKGEMVKCKICKKERYVFPSHAKRGNGVFCSKRCAAIHRNSVQKTSNTDIEQIIENWLRENNINFIPQKIIEGITIVDFFIEPNICIYVDGNYWHNLPKVRERDVWIDQELEQRRFKVIRLWGSDIKKGMRPLL